MAWRCSNCNRLKLFGIGWVSEFGKLYCPTCWAHLLARRERGERRAEKEARSKREEAQRKALEDARRRDEGERAQARSKIEEMRQQLEAYSQGTMPLPPEMVGAYGALVQFALHEVLDPCYLHHTEGNLHSPKEHLKECVEPIARPILRFLSGLKSQETTAGVRDLIGLCLQLTESALAARRFPNYPDQEIRFPVDVLISLGEIDRKTTVRLLCDTASDPDALPLLRSVCITALGNIGDQQAAESLLGVLEEPEDSWGTIISGAACALVDLGDERAVMPIIGAIGRHFFTGNYHDWTARDYIAERMAALLPPGTDVYHEVCCAWRALKEAPKMTDPHRVDPNQAVLSVLERVLLECRGHEAVEIAAEWARSEENYSALEGVKALANLDYEDALDVLCSIVVAPSRRVMVGYHDSGDMWNIPDYGANTEQRIAAAKALAQRGGRKATAALRRAASTKDAEVREAINQLLSDL